MLSGKVGMHTSPVYAEDVYIGAHSGVDRDGHRATFVVPVNAPGVTVVCRKVSARHANPFLAPLSSRFDELDGQMWLEEVLVPWDRVFLTEPSPDPIAAWCFWHQLYAWLAKAEFTLGLALACTHAMGLKDHEPTIEHLMDLVVDVQTVRSCQTAAELDPDVSTAGYCMPGRGHVAAGSIAMQKARQRMAEILRIVPGSSLVVAPSDKDLTSPEVGAGLEESFGGGQYTALQRAALLQLAADHVSSALDGRESAFELHANGGLVGLARAAPARVHRVQRAGQRRAARAQPRHARDRSGRSPGHRRCRNDAPSLRPRPVPPGPRSPRDWDRISSRQPHEGTPDRRGAMSRVGLGQGSVMSRRAVLALAPGLVALGASRALAQRPPGPARIGWLAYVSPPDAGLENLRLGLQELGHVEGKSFVVIPRFANGDFTRLPALVDELLAERLDVLASRGPSVDYLKTARARVPVVFAYSGDPVAAGFADSLAKPGRNMTGITFMALELSSKRVELLKELVPQATQMALLSNPEHAGELAEYRVTEDAARRVGATITRHLARSPAELPAVMEKIRASRPGAMIVFPDSLTLVRRPEIAEFAAREKIPSMFGWTEFTDAGGLASYGPGVTESFKGLAKFVDKILKGADASQVAIEQVSRILLTINMTAARRIGLTVPPSILVRADRVIE